MANIAYIGIGSNVGDRLKYCEAAVRKMGNLKGVKVVAVSPWFENKAVTKNPADKQCDYINGALKIETTLPPAELLNNLQAIELELGRKRTNEKWAPRTIDLDILIYDNLVMASKSLTLPHPEMHKRIFVLKPLCDIEPNLVHPVFERDVKNLYERCSGA